MATTLSALASNYFFLRAYGELLSGPEGALRVAIFLATGVMVSWLADGRKRAEEHLRERNEDLEREVAQRKALEERLVYRATHDYAVPRRCRFRVWGRHSKPPLHPKFAEFHF